MSVFDDLMKNVTDLTENVARKSTAAIETQKLKMRKTSLESDMRDCYVVLGRLYEKQLAAGADPESEEGKALERLSQIRISIGEIQESLKKQKGVVTCPSCGRDVSKGYEFCPKCGTPLKKKGSASAEKAAAEDTAAADSSEDGTDVHGPDHVAGEDAESTVSENAASENIAGENTAGENNN